MYEVTAETLRRKVAMYLEAAAEREAVAAAIEASARRVPQPDRRRAIMADADRQRALARLMRDSAAVAAARAAALDDAFGRRA